MALDRGDGVCELFDEATKLCTVYEERPLLCNVDKAYSEYFKNLISLEEYHTANYNACKLLKTIIK
jgi:Fe-S-cluster containining protein